MTPSEPIFVSPTTVEDALSELADETAIAIAGGTSIAMLMKNDLLDAERLVSLRKIDELTGITELPGGGIRVGATVTLRELAGSALVIEHLPALVEAAEHVGNPRVRAVATIGGAIVHGDARQDIPPVLLALGARVRLSGPNGVREVPLAGFVLGFMETAIDEDELVLDVVIPVEPRQRTAYTRFTPGSVDDYPIVAVATALDLGSDGTVTSARIGLGGATSRAMLAEDAAQLLQGQVPDPDVIAAAASAAAAAANPTSDQRGSADYKRAMVEVWTRRTLQHCLRTERSL